MRRHRLPVPFGVCAITLASCGLFGLGKGPSKAPAGFEVVYAFHDGLPGGHGKTTLVRDGSITQFTHVPSSGEPDEDRDYERTCSAEPDEVDQLWEQLDALHIDTAPEHCPYTGIEDGGGAWIEVHTLNKKVVLQDCSEVGAAAVQLVVNFFRKVCWHH